MMTFVAADRVLLDLRDDVRRRRQPHGRHVPRRRGGGGRVAHGEEPRAGRSAEGRLEPPRDRMRPAPRGRDAPSEALTARPPSGWCSGASVPVALIVPAGSTRRSAASQRRRGVKALHALRSGTRSRRAWSAGCCSAPRCARHRRSGGFVGDRRPAIRTTMMPLRFETRAVRRREARAPHDLVLRRGHRRHVHHVLRGGRRRRADRGERVGHARARAHDRRSA